MFGVENNFFGGNFELEICEMSYEIKMESKIIKFNQEILNLNNFFDEIRVRGKFN